MTDHGAENENLALEMAAAAAHAAPSWRARQRAIWWLRLERTLGSEIAG